MNMKSRFAAVFLATALLFCTINANAEVATGQIADKKSTNNIEINSFEIKEIALTEDMLREAFDSGDDSNVIISANAVESVELGPVFKYLDNPTSKENIFPISDSSISITDEYQNQDSEYSPSDVTEDELSATETVNMEAAALLPDLTVQDLVTPQFSGTIPYLPATQFAFSLINIGDAPVSNIKCEVLDGTTSLGSFIVTDTIKAGYYGHFYFQLSQFSTGSHTIKVVADPNNSIAEKNEQNNSTSKSFNFDGAVDLAVPEFDPANGSNALVNEQIAFNFAVVNIGSDKSKAFKLSLIQGSTVFGTISAPAIEPGYAMGGTIRLTFYSPGIYQLYLEADREQVNTEWTRTNNTRGTRLDLLGHTYVLPTYFTEHYQYPGSYTNPDTGYVHNGWDFKAPEKTPIYALTNGKVLQSGSGSQASGMGNFVWMQHGDQLTSTTLVSRYLHMWTTPSVSAGDVIPSGHLLGGVGKTGTSNNLIPADHLHFDANFNGHTTPVWTEVLSIFDIWPDMNFSHTNSSARSIPANSLSIKDLEELVKNGDIIDARIIRMIGQNEFDLWLSKTSNDTLPQLLSDLSITQDQVRRAMNNDEWYQMMDNNDLFATASK